MTIYPFRCMECGHELEFPVHNPSLPSPCCGAPLRRIWHHISTRRDMEPHWNHSVGGYVRNRLDFEDALKRRSDEASERLGTEHRFRPVDHDCVGATEEGLDLTWKAERDSGKTDSKRRIFP